MLKKVVSIDDMLIRIIDLSSLMHLLLLSTQQIPGME